MARVVVIALYAALCCTASALATIGQNNVIMNNNNPSPSSSSDGIFQQREKAVVVGGGPVGLASAIMLANRGYDVTVLESCTSKEIRTFNPAIAYLYNVNARGQLFTKMFPDTIHEKLIERSVGSTQTGFMLSPADITKNLTYPKLPNFGVATESYWIARHDMTVLLWDAVDEHNTSTEQNNQVGTIEYEQGVSCVGVHPNNNNGESNSISVIVKNKSTGEEKTVKGKLVVGADGIRSRVRKCLKEKSSNHFTDWDYDAKKFQAKKYISPATGLKLKVRVLKKESNTTRKSFFVPISETPLMFPCFF